jgi:SLT domain-containing protein
VAFDAGAITAHMEIDQSAADRGFREIEAKARAFEKQKYKLSFAATLDQASMAHVRMLFSQLDRQISADASQRMRSGSGSVLGSLNSMFSTRQVAGAPTPQQSAQQGGLARVAQAASGGGGGRGIATRIAFGALGGGPGGGGGVLDRGLAGGIGPGILGLSTKLTAGVGLGGSLLGAIPAVGAIGAGLGVIGGGAAAVISGNAGLKKQASGALDSVKTTIQAAAGPLVAPLRAAFGQLPGFIRSIAPELHSLFAGAAPLIKPLLSGLEQLVKGLLPGLVTIIHAALPAFQVLAQILGIVGKDLGQMFSSFAPVIRQSATIFKALAGVIGSLLPIVGRLAAIFAGALAPVFVQFAGVLRQIEPVITVLGRILASLAVAVIRDLVSAFGAVAQLIKAISPSFVILAGILSRVFGVLENSGVFAILGDALEKLVGPLGALINGLVRGLAPILPPIIDLISSLAGTAINVLVSAVTAIVPPLLMLAGILLRSLKPILPPLEQALAQLGGTIGKILVTALKALLPPVALVIAALLKIVVALLPILTPITQLAAVLLTLALKVISPLFPLLNLLARLIADLLTPIAAVLTAIVNFAVNWKHSWQDIKQWASDAWQFIQKGIHAFLLPLFGPNGLIGRAVGLTETGFKQAMSGIETGAKDLWRYIWTDFGAKIINFFTHTIPHTFSVAVSAIGDAWTAIQNVVKVPVNWVIQHVINGLIGAFDWISTKVGGPNIPKLPGLARGGRIPGFGGGDKHIIAVEGGEAVIDKHTTRKNAWLLRMLGVPGFATGGLVGGPLGGRGGVLDPSGPGGAPVQQRGGLGFLGKIGDAAGVIAAVATGNKAALASDLRKLMGSTGVGGAVGDLAQLLLDVPTTLIKDAVNGLIHTFQSVIGGGGALGGVGGNVLSYSSLILEVLAMLGQPASDLRTVLSQMTTESGGNPRAVNLSDINAQHGTPSVGLMQVIGPTFASNAGPFKGVGPFLFGTSINPLANIYAALHYAIGRYGAGWTSVLGHGHGYDSGGWLLPGVTMAVNSSGGREAVLTHGESNALKTLTAASAAMMRGGGQRRGSAQLAEVLNIMLPDGATLGQLVNELNFSLKHAEMSGFTGVTG